jgi:transposase
VDTSEVLETGSMAKRKRRKFTAEYKAEVVGLVQASGKSVRQVAKELELTETAVRAWVRQHRIDGRRDPQGPLTSEERAELTRLRREFKTVTQERDFLKKAAAFFARDGK